jgi:hypothetical protein
MQAAYMQNIPAQLELITEGDPSYFLHRERACHPRIAAGHDAGSVPCIQYAKALLRRSRRSTIRLSDLKALETLAKPMS